MNNRWHMRVGIWNEGCPLALAWILTKCFQAPCPMLFMAEPISDSGLRELIEASIEEQKNNFGLGQYGLVET
jgi:hypothetical protein